MADADPSVPDPQLRAALPASEVAIESGTALVPSTSHTEPKPGSLAQVDAEAKLLQWTAAQAFENLKFMDQKAAVLAASIGIIAAKIGELVAARWLVLSSFTKGVFGLGALLLVAALSASLYVLWPRGRHFSELSRNVMGLEYLDSDTAATRLKGTLGEQRPSQLSPNDWIAAHVVLIRNRGLNAEEKGTWFRIAVVASLAAIAVDCVGVFFHAVGW
jgi:hypothetical protein